MHLIILMRKTSYIHSFKLFFLYYAYLIYAGANSRKKGYQAKNKN